MAVRRLAPKELQPESFAFTDENLAWANQQIAKYPPGRQQSAVIPLLWRAQEQNGGWLPEPAIRYVGEMLGMAHIRALEVATFYTMFLLEPVGRKAHVQVCGTTPCMLRGSDDVLAACKNRGLVKGGTTPDGMEVDTYGEFADRDWSPNEKGFARMVQRIDQTVGRVFRGEGLCERVGAFDLFVDEYPAPDALGIELPGLA